MKLEIFKYESVTSTNDIAINLIRDKQKICGCVYANQQTQGRGTRGKEWISNEGNLFLSIFFPLEHNYPPFNEFSIINSVIISDVIKYLCKKKNITLKFPNDILVNGRKICGILQELITLNNKNFLIIGIGINIISSPKINNKYETTNILAETKKRPKISEIINLTISSYKNFFDDLSSYNFINFNKKANLMALKFKAEKL